MIGQNSITCIKLVKLMEIVSINLSQKIKHSIAQSLLLRNAKYKNVKKVCFNESID